MSWLASPELRLAIALAIGLLIGVERERRKAEQGNAGFAGLRTFALTSFLGSLLAYTHAPALVVAGAAIVGLIAVAAYMVNRDEPDRGMTTELALVVAYVLGVMSQHAPVVAAASAVAVAWLLALRGFLHKLVKEMLTEDELRDGLVFLLFALVVLPVAPDEATGPYGAINPQALARLVVVLMGLAGAAHLAQRMLGPRFGLALTGFVGGFVSSSATIGALGFLAREQPGAFRGAVAGALASSIATVLQYVLIVAALDPSLMAALWPTLTCAALVALVSTLLFVLLPSDKELVHESVGRPFRIWSALGFALIFSVVSVASAALHEWSGASGILVVSVIAALVDAHSTAGSIASLHHAQSLDTHTAELAIVAALSANSVTKVGLAFSGRHFKYGLSVSAGVAAIAAAAWLGFFFT